jgi:conjugative element/phage-associated large polyvalent protein
MKQITTTETAKIVRSALKAAFPAVKLSVKNQGANIAVNWVDGPTTAQVEATVKRYEGSDFDGMTDGRSYHPITVNGEQVRTCCDLIICQRTYSVVHFQKAAALVSAQYGVTAPEIRQGSYEAYVVQDGQSIGADSVAQVVRQTAWALAA